ncbi:MAG: tRNA (adenosine(37)-N6)-threonylcarbamoyltransferase complex ATPase subunit type 1 TsaE [Bacteroidota bacterium]|jgi:tRNA threonylcarbamoyladenosine biosynthesis protein TsaE|nr:tRNA (adenosine(37)-N6)-threonylcarbamoyltransferase complex ATPase subunit type 1 TsaE [Bacteroidota bacterium]HHU00465.1 tRNA (adenosine(37)-N6)-threonylcarbamoyltransferase complex ATPase subunit type 1 TsaE [Bacteroidales bacterium]
MIFSAKTPEELGEAARALVALLDVQPVAAFYGEMGAGKTTLIKQICRELKVLDPVSSPSFAIINEYRCEDGRPVYHFDLYRMKKPEELFDIGADEYLYGGDICLIEWPEKAENHIPFERINVNLQLLPDGTREIRINNTTP